MMAIVRQVTIISAVGFGGVGISALLPIPIPGSIMSMILLFILLIVKIIPLSSVEVSAQFFLRNMGVFFIVPTVAVIEHLYLLQGQVFSFFLICIISTILTSCATIGTFTLCQKLIRAISSKRGQRNE